MMNDFGRQLIGCNVYKDGSGFELIYREKINIVLTSMPPQYPPDKVYKEVYHVIDGKISHTNTIHATVTPPQGERIEW